MSKFKGIDVSVHNGKIDWSKVKAAGIQFAMIRAGYGTNHIDKNFKYNISECNRLGIPCGVYWFSYALNAQGAKKEAQYCLEAVKPYKLEYPIAFDFEYDSVDYAKSRGITITKAMASSFVNAFCGEIEKAGYYAVNYTNKDYLSRYFDAETAKKYGIWLAAWNNTSNPPTECQIWQYSSTGKVSGMSGAVDMNYALIDFPKIIKETGKNNINTGKNDTSKEPYYASALKWAIENGISDGKNPEEPATRAQVVTMLKRYHDKFGK